MKSSLLIPCKGCLVRLPNKTRARVEKAVQRKSRMEVTVRDSNSVIALYDVKELRSGFQPQNEVECMQERAGQEPFGTGIILATRTLGGFDQLCVQFHETGQTRWLPYEMLRIVNPVRNRLMQGDRGRELDHAERFRLRVLSKLLESWDANTGAFGRLDIDPLPHQLDVARKVTTSGAPGWLLADDVGLGKTIEVGLILHALQQRGRGRRILIVCPASLTLQWQEEMQTKFEHLFEIYGTDFMPSSPEMLRAREAVIVSIDLAKREEHAAFFAQGGSWDVIIFDEAHHLGRSDSGERTERFRLAEMFRPLTPLLLLLTATPHQGKTGRFAALLELARPDLRREIARIAMEPSIVKNIVIRNYKPDVTDSNGNLIFQGHDTRRFMVEPDQAMIDFDRDLRAYLKRGYGVAQASGAGRAIGFVMTTYRKLASSSLAAIKTALQRRLRRLREEDGFGSVEEFLTADDIDRDSPLAELKKAFERASFFTDESEMLASLVKQADALEAYDAKRSVFLDEILAPLMAQGEALLIFTEYRATQDYLYESIARRFGNGERIGLVNGSMSITEKRTTVKGFNQGDIQIVISTEAGAEGLNMQERCHILVNYDLPWNPSRLVQRIGRLYRYGQTKRVQVLNLQVDDGFDNKAIGMMLDRVDAIAHDLSSVITENREALEAQIVGELLSRIDMEEILRRAGTGPVERTAEQIEAATRSAIAAQRTEMDFLQHAERHHGITPGGLDGRHMMAFAIGMAPHLDIAIRALTHDEEVLEVEVPEALAERVLSSKRRRVLKLTSSPSRARRTADLEPLDFDNPLLREMVKRARERSFDGLMAQTNVSIDGDALSIHLLRWQDRFGTLLEDEVVPITIGFNGQVRLESMDKLGALFLKPWPSQSDLPEARTSIDLGLARPVLDAHWRGKVDSNRFPGAESVFAAILVDRRTSHTPDVRN